MFLRDRLRLEEEWSNIGAQCRDLGGYVVDPTKTSYVLNPGGDLIKTQQRFEDLLDDQEWRGIVGREPESGEICDMLSSSDVFLYGLMTHADYQTITLTSCFLDILDTTRASNLFADTRSGSWIVARWHCLWAAAAES